MVVVDVVVEVVVFGDVVAMVSLGEGEFSSEVEGVDFP